MKKNKVVLGTAIFGIAMVLVFQNCAGKGGGSSGTFGLPVASLITLGSGGPGVSPNGITSGRFNEAAGGHNDLLISGASNVYRIVGKGDGTFATALLTGIFDPAFAGVIQPKGVQTFNYYVGPTASTTKHLGVITVNNPATSVFLDAVQGNGDGTFLPASFTSASSAAAGSNVGGISIADLNGDGILDIGLLYPGVSEQSSTVSRVTGGNASYIFGLSSIPDNVVDSFTIDVTGDKIPDLVVIAANQIIVVAGLGNGIFHTVGTAPTSTLTLPAGASLTHIAGGDLNADGKADLVVTTSAYSTGPGLSSFDVYFLKGDNTGVFTVTSKTSIPVGSGGSPAVLMVQDLNADTKPDIAVAYSGATAAVPAQNYFGLYTAVSTTAGPQFPTLAKSPAVVNVAAGVLPVGLTINDFNGDLIPDVVVATGGDATAGNQSFYFFTGKP